MGHKWFFQDLSVQQPWAAKLELLSDGIQMWLQLWRLGIG